MSSATASTAATLTQARRLAVTKKLRIEFATTQGHQCIIDEHGVARVPGLQSAPEFSLTTEFATASEFTLVEGAQRRKVTATQLAELSGAQKPAADHHDDDE